MSKGFLGIDVSKGYADFVLLDENLRELENVFQLDDTRPGHDNLNVWLALSIEKHGLTQLLCAVESTGGFENNWYAMLVNASAQLPLKVSRLNPSVVKNATRAELHPNTTDALSAVNIARYMKRFEDRVDFCEQDKTYSAYRSLHNHIALLTKQKSQIITELKQLLYGCFPELQRYCKQSIPGWVLELLSQYPSPAKLARAKPEKLARIGTITPAKATLLIESAKKTVASRSTATDEFVIMGMAQDIEFKQQQIDKYKKHLAEKCAGAETELLQSVKGIGAFSAASIMIQIEDIKRFATPKALACYFGLHPVQRQSGDKKMVSRMSKQGRPAIRAVLYMCASTAVMHDPHLKSIYARHRARGKNHRQALGAIMHKMLRIIWGMLHTGTAYNHEVDEKNQQKKIQPQQETEMNESNAKRRIQAYDESAPISRLAHKKRKVLAASQSGSAEQMRDLAQEPMA